MALHTYLPQDRLRALARGETLPDRTHGSALFADISGFTPLTEALRESLGPRRGAEELTQILGRIYTTLIAQVEKYGGSVITFAGDAFLCWFDNEHGSTAPRATACAFSLQHAMRNFAALPLPDGGKITLQLKVAVATGAARRFVMGDPEVQKLDALAGATVARTSTGEHHANRGDVILDEKTAQALGESLVIQEWRDDTESGERFAVVTQFTSQAPEPRLPASLLPPAAINFRAWLHGAVYERTQFGEETFLTEFRPCVTLFIRFIGIDYDNDSAETNLNAFIRKAQIVAAKFDGILMDVTIGDKGSYAYVNFGALSAHEDDAQRAVRVGLELQEAARELTFLQSLQIGITSGILRVGDNGGATRRVFSAIGDEVNLAARLMTASAPGEILVSGHVYKAVQNIFVFEPRPPIQMKGKAEPIPVFAVTGKRQQHAVRLQEPNYALPMVGRQNELQFIETRMGLAASGKGQAIGIVAEAGLGKSRLVAEVIRSAHRMGFVGYGGACQSSGIHTPYLAWKSIWQAFFDVDPDMPMRKQLRVIEGEIEDRAANRVNAMPLLNAVLDLNIAENDFTKNLEPKVRQSALHALFEDCLKSASKDAPLLIVIEDLHWIDALSHDLLEGLVKALANYAVCFVLAYRPPELERLQAARLESLQQFTKIQLCELSRAEAEQAIRAKLAQLYPARSGAVPAQLVDKLMARAQGNPFYLEELLNFLRDRGLDSRDPANLEKIELPDSLHTLILSRLDQLSEQEKITLRVASVVGRQFRARWLTGYYPELGVPSQVKNALEELEALDITPLDAADAELAYLFKHIVTHEVTYESLPFATRARLHEQLAQYLESTYPETPPLDVLAFHYGHSRNTEKQIEYLRKAGGAAQKNFANDAALEYYGKLLSLLQDEKEQIQIHLKRGEVLEFIGKWDNAESHYRSALDSAKDDMVLKADAQFALGKLSRLRGEYASALEWLWKANETRTALQDMAGMAQAFTEMGNVWLRKGDNTSARTSYEEGLSLNREMGDKRGIAGSLNSLGNMVFFQGDYTAARASYEESLSLSREVGDKAGITGSLNNLGNVAFLQGDHTVARASYEESLSLRYEMGDKLGIATSLGNLGNVALSQGDSTAARALHEESLILKREMGAKLEIAISLSSLGSAALAQNDTAAARASHEECLSLFRGMDNKLGIEASLSNLGGVALAQGDYPVARALYEESLALCQEMDDKSSMAFALLGLGLVDLAASRSNPAAREHILRSLCLRQELGEQCYQTSSLVGVAGWILQMGDARQAAQWLGAVESALKALHAVMEPELLHFHAQTLAAVKEKLDSAAFQSAWEEGSRWSLEEAVKRALEEAGLARSG